MKATPRIAIIGGSGLYSMFARSAPGHLDTIEVETPWGPPSAPIEVAQVGSTPIAFLPRHGTAHQYPPHAIPYRANLAALSQLGVRQILAPCAAGSLQPECMPGSLVIPDQLVDQTSARAQTFHERFEGTTFHARFAEPYCEQVRQSVLESAEVAGWPGHDGGTVVVIDGPRFSTRAEAQWYGRQGWTLVNMTGHPEAVLARELGICYATIALVTDLAANLTTGLGVREQDVYRLFAENTERLRALLLVTVERLGRSDDCACAA